MNSPGITGKKHFGKLSKKAYTIRQVDFAHPEYCTDCHPTGCILDGSCIPGSTWRELFVNIINDFRAKRNPNIRKLFQKNLNPNSNRPFFTKEKPNGAARQIASGHWVYVNYNIATIVEIIGKLCQYCGVNLDKVIITYAPKIGINIEDASDLPNSVVESLSESSVEDALGDMGIPKKVMTTILKEYTRGIKFDATTLRLLFDKAGTKIHDDVITAMKRFLFRRADDIYFLLDAVAEPTTRNDIIIQADEFLDEFGCFEVMVLYDKFAERVSDKCIVDMSTFEDFYKFICIRDVRCVTASGIRIARVSGKSTDVLFRSVAEKVIGVADKAGIVSEDELRDNHLPAFTCETISGIIKNYADSLLETEINGSIYYQTYDALGLSEEFSETLSEILSEIDDLQLEPSEAILHAALSLKKGHNFRLEYNIGNDKAFRSLITACYKGEPVRKWKYGLFTEIQE